MKKMKYNLLNLLGIMSKVEEKKVEQYQWKKGDNFGKIVEVESSDSTFVYFTDGSRIFKNSKNEFLEPIINGEIPFPGADAVMMGIQRDESITPPAQRTSAPDKTSVKDSVQSSTSSPLFSLIDKLSKKNVEMFNLSMGLNLPKKDIFNMIIENSDEGKDEIVKEITNVAISQIEIDKLQDYLKEEIIKFVNNYYNE